MIKLYSNLESKDTILELWGGSTKHPDSRFFFSDFQKSEWVDTEAQVFQWILECASKMNFPFHGYKLMKFAEKYYSADKTEKELSIMERL